MEVEFKRYCVRCGRKYTITFFDERVNEVSYWCDYHSETFILITQFQKYIDKGLTTHSEIQKRIQW
jgi:hypothetical protein